MERVYAFDAVAGQAQAGAGIRLAIGAGTEKATVDIGIVDPFGAGAAIGAQHADTDAVDMQTRTHGLADNFEADADGAGIEQFAEHLGKQLQVVGQRFAPGAGRQTRQVRRLSRRQGLAKPCAKIIQMGFQPVGDDRIDGAAPCRQLDLGVEDARQADRFAGARGTSGHRAGQGGIHFLTPVECLR